jgi:hypothetical protein
MIGIAVFLLVVFALTVYLVKTIIKHDNKTNYAETEKIVEEAIKNELVEYNHEEIAPETQPTIAEIYVELPEISTEIVEEKVIVKPKKKKKKNKPKPKAQ